MREIKFRARDRKNKVFIYFTLEKLIAKVGAASISENLRSLSYYYYWTDDVMKDCQEYTGLLDKNGKEIYEGDVVKIYEKGTAQVIWKEGRWFLEPITTRYNTSLFIVGIERREVIGNIHENPELLKEK